MPCSCSSSPPPGAQATGALAAPAGTTHYPDLQTVIPTNSFSVVQGTDGPEFRYTHLVYNAGPGPLEIQPQYNRRAGSYQGQQQLYTHNASNDWSLVSSVRVPDAFVFHAAHGHFHFPLAAFGLYAVAPGRRHRRAGTPLAEERLLHRRLLHLRHDRRARRGVRRARRAAARTRRRCAG